MNSLSAALFSWTKTWRAQQARASVESTAIYATTDTFRLSRSEMAILSVYFVLTLFTLCSGKAVAGEHSRAFSIGVPASAHVFCGANYGAQKYLLDAHKLSQY